MSQKHWLCPVCGALNGAAVTACEGYVDIPDPDLGETVELDAMHTPITRDNAVLYWKEHHRDAEGIPLDYLYDPRKNEST